jgi:hypothetical protein
MSISTEALFEFKEILGIDDNKEPSGLEKMLADFYSTENIEMKTELNQSQINSIVKAKTFIQRYKSNYMSEYIKNIMILSISKSRQGRKEWGEIAKREMTMEESKKSLSERLFGM